MDAQEIRQEIEMKLSVYLGRLHKFCLLMGAKNMDFWEDPPTNIQSQYDFLKEMQSQGLAVLKPGGEWTSIFNGIRKALAEYGNLDRIRTAQFSQSLQKAQQKAYEKAMKELRNSLDQPDFDLMK